MRAARAAGRAAAGAAAGTLSSRAAAAPPGAYDVAVVGGGIAGVCVAYECARRGARTLLLERHDMLHRRGSSHGESRIIRPTYAEEHYTAMMRKAYPLWESAQQEARTSVYTPTGGLDFGPAEGAGMRRVLAAAEANGVRAERMDAERVSRRFPGFSIPDHWTALWNADAGILNATKAVAMYAGLAERHGAALRDRSAVVGIDHAEGGMMRLAVQDNSRGASSGAGTSEGAGGGVAQSVVARRVVVAAGPWAGALLEDTLGLRLDLRPIATAVAYWRARDAQARHRFDAARFPVYICYGDDQTEADALPPGWDETGGSTGDSRASIDFQTLYGFPIHELPGLIKASLHLPEAHWERLGRDADDRTMAPDAAQARRVVGKWVSRHFEGIDTDEVALTEACTYTMTPDHDYVFDTAADGKVVVLSCCSGHGFKLAPLIGAATADLALEGGTERIAESTMQLFSADRLAL